MATLKQSTAYTRMFFMVSSTDHVTGVTGLSSPDSITLTRSKAGAGFNAVSGVIAEVANGWYKVSLTTGDTDTLGDLAFHGTATGADPVDWVDQVTAQILGDTLTANTTQIEGSDATDQIRDSILSDATRFAGANIDATISSRLASASYTAPPSAATNAAAVWDLDATGHQTQGTFGQVLGDSGSDSDSVWSLANTNLDATVSSRLASGSYTAPPSAATNAAAVWDLDATAHQTQGTFGQAIGDPGADTDTIFGLLNTNLDTTVSSRLASSSISLSGGAVTVGTNNDKTGYSLTQTFPTNFSSLAISVGGEVTVGTNSDKTGYSLTSAYDPAKTAAQAGDAMALTSGERNSTADAILDRSAGIETGVTPRQGWRLMLAALAGKASGLATTTAVYRDTNDSKDRITATVDSSGNRSAVTLDAS